jgi:hypothetical protein
MRYYVTDISTEEESKQIWVEKDDSFEDWAKWGVFGSYVGELSGCDRYWYDGFATRKEAKACLENLCC